MSDTKAPYPIARGRRSKHRLTEEERDSLSEPERDAESPYLNANGDRKDSAGFPDSETDTDPDSSPKTEPPRPPVGNLTPSERESIPLEDMVERLRGVVGIEDIEVIGRYIRVTSSNNGVTMGNIPGSDPSGWRIVEVKWSEFTYTLAPKEELE